MSLGDSATELGKVRGLGSARHGGHHWIGERVTSIALLVLGLWLLASLLFLPDLGQRTVVEWLRMPSAAVPMVLLVLVGFRHAVDGLQVVIDDYVHDEGNRFAVSFLVLSAAWIGAALALWALGTIVFGGAA